MLFNGFGALVSPLDFRFTFLFPTLFLLFSFSFNQDQRHCLYFLFSSLQMSASFIKKLAIMMAFFSTHVFINSFTSLALSLHSAFRPLGCGLSLSVYTFLSTALHY